MQDSDTLQLALTHPPPLNDWTLCSTYSGCCCWQLG